MCWGTVYALSAEGLAAIMLKTDSIAHGLRLGSICRRSPSHGDECDHGADGGANG